jgi:hypothetical protein
MKPVAFSRWIVWVGMVIALQTSCAAPRALWPQKDHPAGIGVGVDAKHKVLLASRDSAFKRDVVLKVNAALSTEDTAVQVIGIGELETIDATQYDAVVLINTCIALGFDSEVKTFLDRHDHFDHMIIVTTSSKGDWQPKEKNRDYDAISSASKLAESDAVARKIVESVRKRIGGR